MSRDGVFTCFSNGNGILECSPGIGMAPQHTVFDMAEDKRYTGGDPTYTSYGARDGFRTDDTTKSWMNIWLQGKLPIC